MDDVTWPRVAWRWWHPLSLWGPPVSVAFLLAGRLTGALPGYPVAVVGGLLLTGWAFALRGLGWSRLGLVVDDSGITLGGDAEYRPDQQVWKVMGARFHAPWNAVYDAHLVTDWRALVAMHRVAFADAITGVAVNPRRPAFFASRHQAVLTFRVDLRRVEMPPLPDGVIPSHVWAVPVRDVEAVRRALTRRGIQVSDGHGDLGPTPVTWFDPLTEDQRRAAVHAGVAEPLPANDVELDAAVVLETGRPPFAC